MRTLFSLLLILPALLAAQTTPIANIQDSTSVYNGQTVTIEGVVFIGAGVTHGSMLNVFIQDSSGKGVMMFDYDITSAYENDLVRGARLQVTGEVSEYNGVTELTDFSYTVLETGVDVTPYIVPLSLAEADNTSEWEGTFIEVSGELYEDPYSVGGGVNLNIEDANGDQLTVRVWDSTGISLPSLTQGSELTAHGALGIYSGNAQALPGYQDDIIVEVTEEPTISGVSYSPTNPTMDDPISVSCTITDADGTVEEAFLEYRLATGASFTSVDMSENGSTYSGVIPAMSTMTSEPNNFVFRIVAIDDDDNEGVSAEQVVVVSGGSQFITIAEIQDNTDYYDGQEVEVEAVVTIGANVLRTDQLSAYIQDVSGRGMQLYASSITSAYENDIVRGNRLQITGTVEEYNGTTELTDFTYTVVGTGVSMDDVIIESSIPGVADYEYWEGTYMSVQGILTDTYYAGGGMNLYYSGGGGEITVRLWDTTGVDYSGFAVGNEMIVAGVISSYNGASQSVAGYQEDFVNLSNPFIFEWTPEVIFPADTVHVTATIAYIDPIETATIHYRPTASGLFNEMPMTAADDDKFTAALPPLQTLSDDSEGYLVYVTATTTAAEYLESSVDSIHVYSGAPVFEDIAFDSNAMASFTYVNYPFLDENIDVVAEIVDYDGTVASATVYYGLAGGANLDSTIVMNDVGANHWSATLPPLASLTMLDDDYIVRLSATDDEGRVTMSEIIDIEVSPRCPIVTNIATANDTLPEAGEDLEISLRIRDTDGGVNLDTAMLWCQFDVSSDVVTIPLTVSETDSTRFTGVITGRSGGTTVYVNAEAYDYYGNAASLYPGWEDNTIEYTWPVRKHTAILKIPPKPFDPYHGETMPISYLAGPGDKVILRIYSAEGKLVHTPVNAIVPTDFDQFDHVYEWDGRNRARRLLPLGIYICHLEVVDAEGGNKKTDRAPIVIGAPLN